MLNRLSFFVYVILIANTVVHADVGEPLFLSPYIRDGQLDLARELSQVKNLTSFLEPKSYSGFITVNETHEAHIFFWFFPAQIINDDSPVVLWCEGGPGLTGLYPLFNGNGPYKLDQSFNIRRREYTWNMEYSMIFLDNPVGAGFSFTKSDEGYLRSSLDPAHLYIFLQQFFTLFPEYLRQDFYAGGHSFGAGKYAPIIAKEIHDRNRDNSGIKINLKGVILEAPYAEPLSQLDYGEFLYSIGILDQEDLEIVNAQTELGKQHIINGRYEEAYLAWINVLVSPDSYIQNRTGIEAMFLGNYMGFQFPKDGLGEEYLFAFYLEQEFVRKAIHVGNTSFLVNGPMPTVFYEDKGLLSSSGIIEQLLNATEGYKILVYCGQLDVITYHLGIKKFVEELKWPGALEFNSARSNPFKSNVSPVQGIPNGFVTQARNLTYLLVRNAGHDAIGDQRPIIWDAINRFIKNRSFTD